MEFPIRRQRIWHIEPSKKIYRRLTVVLGLLWFAVILNAVEWISLLQKPLLDPTSIPNQIQHYQRTRTLLHPSSKPLRLPICHNRQRIQRTQMLLLFSPCHPQFPIKRMSMSPQSLFPTPCQTIECPHPIPSRPSFHRKPTNNTASHFLTHPSKTRASVGSLTTAAQFAKNNLVFYNIQTDRQCPCASRTIS